jgi:DNA-binding winged helix-turn-helix (wHTH) protein
MVYRFGDFELDEEERELRRDGTQIPLQPLIFDLLAMLVRTHRRVVSKEELMETLWPDVIVSEASLQRAISFARSAVGDDARSLIRTFVGRGYRFCADVREVEPEGRPQAGQSTDATHQGPRIQYARTSDGVNIAYWTLGEGEPALVHLAPQFSHTQLEWQMDECRRWYESLAEKRMLVRFDPRGWGLSDRNVADVSRESALWDLDAVVDRLGLEEFALFGMMYFGSEATAYAARHPDRVSHLILWCASAVMADWRQSPQMQALISLRDKDWEFYTEAAARVVMGWSAGEPARRHAALFREGVKREMLLARLPAIFSWDLTNDLAKVRSPTLVLHRRQYAALGLDAARNLAAGIPNARLAILEGESAAPYTGDVDAALSAIEEFLREG